jgi:succinylglutamate desuccinylase
MTKTTKLPKKLHKNLSAQQVTRLSMFVLFTRPRLTAKLQRFSFEDQNRCGFG